MSYLIGQICSHAFQMTYSKYYFSGPHLHWNLSLDEFHLHDLVLQICRLVYRASQWKMLLQLVTYWFTKCFKLVFWSNGSNKHLNLYIGWTQMLTFLRYQWQASPQALLLISSSQPLLLLGRLHKVENETSNPPLCSVFLVLEQRRYLQMMFENQRLSAEMKRGRNWFHKI